MTLALSFVTTRSDDAVASVSTEYRDLAPMITRQQHFRTIEIAAREF